MVKGLNIFTEYFRDFAGNYVVIGGTACDMLVSEEGLVPRATKDIDIILLVEALPPNLSGNSGSLCKKASMKSKSEARMIGNITGS